MALLLSHRLPLPVPLLLAFLLAVSSYGAPSGDDTYDPSLCLSQGSQPSACGKVSIKYPFYLSDKTADILGNSISYCGYPGLGIHCEDGNAIMQLGGNNNYKVSGIDYNNFIVTVADKEAFDDASCPKVDHNVTIPQTSWLKYPNDTVVDYLVFFLNCHGFPGFRLPNTSSITCGVLIGELLSFVLLRDDVPEGDWKKACQVFEVPILKSVLPPNISDPIWRDGGYGDALRTGFQLMWEQKNSSCSQCERSNGMCSYNQTMEFVGCLCSGGQVGANRCSSDLAHSVAANDLARPNGESRQILWRGRLPRQR